MIKILFLIHDLGQGGAEKVLVNLINNMDPNNFDITLVSVFGGGENEKFLKNTIKYKAIFPRMIPGNSKILKIMSPQQLHRIMIKEKYDIEISYLEGVSARIISGCPNNDTKLVSWIHVEQHTKKIASIAFRNYDEAVKCYQKFDGTVCVSKAVEKDFKELFPMIQNTTVLYNTNETNDILAKKSEPVEKGLFNENELKICGVGKIVPTKGFDKLARIHHRLKLDGFPVHTYILGFGSEQEKIEKYLKQNNLEESFTFLGYQLNPYKYLSKCDLFVCSSTAEGFSTAATEALILGVPVVTTPVAGMQEMLGNNEYGLISEMDEESLYETIKMILESNDLFTHYKECAVKRGKAFLKEVTVNATEKYIKDIFSY